GPVAESAAQRLRRHRTSLSALEDPSAIASAVLAAAVDLMGLESAALVRPAAMAGTRAAPAAVGPLADALTATPAAGMGPLTATPAAGMGPLTATPTAA